MTELQTKIQLKKYILQKEAKTINFVKCLVKKYLKKCYFGKILLNPSGVSLVNAIPSHPVPIPSGACIHPIRCVPRCLPCPRRCHPIPSMCPSSSMPSHPMPSHHPMPVPLVAPPSSSHHPMLAHRCCVCVDAIPSHTTRASVLLPSSCR